MLDLDLVRNVVDYYNENESTVRETAKVFGIPKSTVYHYLTVIFPNPRSKEILEKNRLHAHKLGGDATRKKYLKLRS